MSAKNSQSAASERIVDTFNGWGVLIVNIALIVGAIVLLHQNVVKLDDERKAAMVSNLLVVLCGNSDPSPVINTGTLYT